MTLCFFWFFFVNKNRGFISGTLPNHSLTVVFKYIYSSFYHLSKTSHQCCISMLTYSDNDIPISTLTYAITYYCPWVSEAVRTATVRVRESRWIRIIIYHWSYQALSREIKQITVICALLPCKSPLLCSVLRNNEKEFWCNSSIFSENHHPSTHQVDMISYRLCP